jgi:hypothetical protein
MALISQSDVLSYESFQIVNRHPPFGNNTRDSVASLPKYEVMVEQSSHYSSQSADLTVSVRMVNAEVVMKKNTAGPTHSCALVIGDTDNKIVCKVRLNDSFLNKIGTWSKRLNVQRASKGDELSINYISQEWGKMSSCFDLFLSYLQAIQPHSEHSQVLYPAFRVNENIGKCTKPRTTRNTLVSSALRISHYQDSELSVLQIPDSVSHFPSFIIIKFP